MIIIDEIRKEYHNAHKIGCEGERLYSFMCDNIEVTLRMTGALSIIDVNPMWRTRFYGKAYQIIFKIEGSLIDVPFDGRETVKVVVDVSSIELPESFSIELDATGTGVCFIMD